MQNQYGRQTGPIPRPPPPQEEGLGPRKTMVVLIIVAGCIAILVPKIFYPMFVRPDRPAHLDDVMHEGCCRVVLATTDANITANSNGTHIGPSNQRKKLNIYTSDMSLPQERPPYMRRNGVHPAMQERGRAIPAMPTVPIVNKPGNDHPKQHSKTNPPPRLVPGRPGPVPGLRPPMGAGATHQSTPKGSMGILFPLYTCVIIALFVYTLSKVFFKKSVETALYGDRPKPNPEFEKQVFRDREEPSYGYKRPQDPFKTNLGWKEHNQTIEDRVFGDDSIIDKFLIEKKSHHRAEMERILRQFDDVENLSDNDQLMEIEALKKKLRETEKAMAQLVEQMHKIPVAEKRENNMETNGDIEHIVKGNGHVLENPDNDDPPSDSQTISADEISESSGVRRRRGDKSVKVVGMELTASNADGQKWGRPGTPTFISTPHNVTKDEPEVEPPSIYLEGAIPHDPKILVSDSETVTEAYTDEEDEGTEDNPAVVLRSKMTLSLFNSTDQHENESDKENDLSCEEKESRNGDDHWKKKKD